MKTYKQFVNQINEGVKAIHAFDIDDTTFKSPKLRVHVNDHTGKRIKSLDTHQFASHSSKKLPKGHNYDFSEFKSAEKFKQHAKPIHKMVNHLKKVSSERSNKVIFNTARSDFDDKKKFVKSLKHHGVDAHKVHVVRAGNIKQNIAPAKKKAIITHGYIKSHKPKEVHMYDDDHNNLHHFKKLKDHHPNVTFYSHHVKSDGSYRTEKV